MKKKKVCPGLSLVYDNSKHWIIANPFHKCDFQVKPERVSLLHQDIYCLSENHINCPIYLKASLLHPHKTTPIANTNPRITIPFLRSKSLTFRQKVYLLYFLWIVVLIIWTVIAKIGPFSFLKPISVSEGNQNTELIDSLTPERNSTNISVNAQLTDQENKVPLLSSSTTRTPTRTSTQTPATDLSSTLPLCVKPNGWIVYTVEPLVTLEMLSNWTNTSEEDLMEANCLITTELVVGQRIFLPKFPVFPAVTHTPFPTPIHNSPLVTPTATVIPTRTSTIIPTPTSTKNPLFKDTPTPPMIPPTTTPVATDTPIPTDEGTP